MLAGFVAMVAGLLLGSTLQKLKTDATPVRGARLAMVMQLTHSGSESLRHAGIAAMSDGVMTMGEERRLYSIADELAAVRASVRNPDPAMNVGPEVLPHGPVRLKPPSHEARRNDLI